MEQILAPCVISALACVSLVAKIAPVNDYFQQKIRAHFLSPCVLMSNNI